ARIALLVNSRRKVIRVSTGFNNQNRWPMRIAEAQITLGVVSAREGDLEGAVRYGRRAIANGRKSLPSLAIVSQDQDLTNVLTARFDGEQEAADYLEELRAIQRP